MPVELRYYELLGIEPNATADDVRKAYRKQSLKWHPDKNPGQRELAEEKFKLLAEAYSVLSDVEMRERYDRYGEDGLKRGFQPPSASGPQYSSGHHQHHTHSSGHEFRFRSADDIFRDFFGGRDPFSSMFMESVFADHFADPFFSQHSGSSGLRAAAEPHMPIERERRPYAGGGGGMTTTSVSSGGFGFHSVFGGGGAGGGFPSMMFSSFGGSGMPATGTFSFVSSSTVGGDGGMRGAAGPSTRTSIQIVNGVKIQITEENDGQGNVTVTKVSPDGFKEVTVNGVRQKSTPAGEAPPRKPIDDDKQNSQARPRSGSYARQPSPPPASSAHASSAAKSSSGHRRVEDSDDESVVEVEVIEVDDSGDSDSLPPPSPAKPQRAPPLSQQPQPPKPSAERTRAPVHKVHSPPTAEPMPKRRDPEVRKAKAAPSDYYAAPLPAAYKPPAQPPTQQPTQQPSVQPSTRAPPIATMAPRNEAEDMLAQARSRLKSSSGVAPPQPQQHQQTTSTASHGSGFKEVLKATGASLLKARPKMNRSSSATKAGPQPQPQPAGSRTFGPIHRRGPVSDLKPPAMSAAEHKAGAYGGQRYYEPIDSTSQHTVPVAAAASIPPLPPQPQYQQPQVATGLSTPGHKQPRSRDRMRSTLYHNNFSAMGPDTKQHANQHHLASGPLSSPPPLPQQPLDPRTATTGYAQYQYYQPSSLQQGPGTSHYYGQAMYVDPTSPHAAATAQASYVSPPMTANSADGGNYYGQQQQQPANAYSGQPLSATQARNQQQQQQMYSGSQHAGVSAGHHRP
ncbi:DnaJ sub B member 6 [Coemansia sp. BCRC 34301]|nr:DnaJ sub B member 6 [Coemansia sp. BCRC 34301]